MQWRYFQREINLFYLIRSGKKNISIYRLESVHNEGRLLYATTIFALIKCHFTPFFANSICYSRTKNERTIFISYLPLLYCLHIISNLFACAYENTITIHSLKNHYEVIVQKIYFWNFIYHIDIQLVSIIHYVSLNWREIKT